MSSCSCPLVKKAIIQRDEQGRQRTFKFIHLQCTVTNARDAFFITFITTHSPMLSGSLLESPAKKTNSFSNLLLFSAQTASNINIQCRKKLICTNVSTSSACERLSVSSQFAILRHTKISLESWDSGKKGKGIFPLLFPLRDFFCHILTGSDHRCVCRRD